MAAPLPPATDTALRCAVIAVALANLAYLFVEFAVARRIGSVSLLADSVDFLEDAAVNFLIVAALGWPARNDSCASIAIVASGLVTLHWACAWPDLMVGLAIAAINAGAAKSVWHAARDEHAAASQARGPRVFAFCGRRWKPRPCIRPGCCAAWWRRGAEARPHRRPCVG